MKTYIPKQPKQIRERLEAKLDKKVIELLEAYCRYMDSERDYVIGQVLTFIFRKDKGFNEWLSKQPNQAASALKSPAV